MRDLFTEHSVPARSRERIITELAEAGEDMTVYDVMQAVTVVANADGVSPDATEQLLRAWRSHRPRRGQRPVRGVPPAAAGRFLC